MPRLVSTIILGWLVATTTLADAAEAQRLKLAPWVTAPPSAETQTQLSAKERGVNPCDTPDPGFGVYGQWHRDVRFGQYLRPVRGGLRKDSSFDVMFHFHGHEPVRKEWVKVMDGAVFASVDLGIGSGAYETTFQDPTAFAEYLHSLEAAIAKATGNKRAHVRHIGVSAWSAGYGAIVRILAQPLGRRVDTVILLDGLHAGYIDGHVNGQQIQDVVDFAKDAAKNRKFFFFSHSSIVPPGYASTTEVANFLTWSVNGKPKTWRKNKRVALGLELISMFDRGSMHIRGYRGNDKMDHCAHIGLYPEILRLQVKPRWKSPRGRKE